MIFLLYMNTKQAMNHLRKQFEDNEDYRYSWQANIAMAMIDNWRWYEKKSGKKYMNYKDKHTIANNAANYFLKQLCMPINTHTQQPQNLPIPEK